MRILKIGLFITNVNEKSSSNFGFEVVDAHINLKNIYIHQNN